MLFIDMRYDNHALAGAINANFKKIDWQSDKVKCLDLDPTMNPNITASEMTAHAFFSLQENPNTRLFYYHNRLFNTIYWLHIVDDNYYGFALGLKDNSLTGIFCKSSNLDDISEFVSEVQNQ